VESREAAKECSPRHKPWEKVRIHRQAPEGAKEKFPTKSDCSKRFLSPVQAAKLRHIKAGTQVPE
jgi:hypothetical protein